MSALTDGGGAEATMPAEAGGVGSLMRHYFAGRAPRAVPRLAGGVAKPAGAALLIAVAGALAA